MRRLDLAALLALALFTDHPALDDTRKRPPRRQRPADAKNRTAARAARHARRRR